VAPAVQAAVPEDPVAGPTADLMGVPMAGPEGPGDQMADPTADRMADPTADRMADPTVDPTADPTADPTEDPTADRMADPAAGQRADQEDPAGRADGAGLAVPGVLVAPAGHLPRAGLEDLEVREGHLVGADLRADREHLPALPRHPWARGRRRPCTPGS
jgi:hypothetical protein